MHVCGVAVSTLADSEKFPDDWLFKHRWGKGKKDKPTKMPDGSAITFLTVGGRTSCVVPSRQKKTGVVAADVPDAVPGEPKATGAKDDAAGDSGESSDPPRASSSPRKKRKAPPAKTPPARGKKPKSDAPPPEDEDHSDQAEGDPAKPPPGRKRKAPPPPPTSKAATDAPRRQSGRLSRG